MELRINGKLLEVSADRQDPLLWVLRDELGLTGTKFGCGIGICGACTVHLNGVAVRACITPLAAASGQDIRTVEGLAHTDAAGNEVLHPVQQAFIEHQVPQCAWCMNGQMMTAAAFLEQNPNPSLEDISSAMAANYCRCGCYTRIRTAVAKAAELQQEVS